MKAKAREPKTPFMPSGSPPVLVLDCTVGGDDHEWRTVFRQTMPDSEDTDWAIVQCDKCKRVERK